MADAIFDFVVVGGGSAGCALAARLSAAGHSVALIEAGGSDATKWVTVPAALIGTVPTRRLNWAYQTVPQIGLGNRRGYQPRGKVLGGSSSINAMVYVRGHPLDYDDWAQAGCDGWSWSDVLHYFRKSEGTIVPGLDPDLHGTGGPLKVSPLRSPSRFNDIFLTAARSCGYAANPDFNGRSQDGVGYYHVTQFNGERWNAARAYLETVADHSNLHVVKDALVTRLQIEDRRATGVQYVRGGERFTVRAGREVVVSCGTFASPQLLMVSGIGPGSELRKFGIPIIVDRPEVGNNLQDHLDCLITRRFNDSDLIGPSLGALLRLPARIREYSRFRRGQLTSNYAESGGFVRSVSSLDRPDIQWHFVVAQADDHGRRRNWGQGYALHSCILRPASRGTVRLATADMSDAPLIDPAFLSDPRDMNLMVRAYKLSQRILQSPMFGDVRGASLHHEPAMDDDPGIEQFIRDRSDTIYHPVGTCRMGSDNEAVVDTSLRVRGIGGLRVVDASIMPSLIGGNTNAPTIMIAEKAVNIITGSRAA